MLPSRNIQITGIYARLIAERGGIMSIFNGTTIAG